MTSLHLVDAHWGGPVLYAPALQRAFGTTPLSATDWLKCLIAASAVLWLRETEKLVARRRAGR